MLSSSGTGVRDRAQALGARTNRFLVRVLDGVLSAIWVGSYAVILLLFRFLRRVERRLERITAP
jgi:hypothetical protein